MHTLSLTPKRVNIIIRATALTSEKMNALDLFNFKKKEVTEEGLWHWSKNQIKYLTAKGSSKNNFSFLL